ncbi:TPR-like protein [Rhizoctonia solani]|uniref:TPR-like protein n=1 Tax=Rhizoctonia solani TaxID=456999 RepID=A0A8H7LZM4_9AGAM|nr:TPR-like protein [Rhizoctonia solani]
MCDENPLDKNRPLGEPIHHNGDVPIGARLYNIAKLHRANFKHTQEIECLDFAISNLLKATSTITEGDKDHYLYQSDLGKWFQIRFEHLGNILDSQSAIYHLNKALDLSSTTPLNHTDTLHHLGVSYQTRFERLGTLDNSLQATNYFLQAVKLTPDKDAEKPSRLSSLGVSYQARFERLGDPADLDLSIRIQLEARQGQIIDIDQGIQSLTQALQQTSPHNEQLQGYLTNLGLSHFLRFDRLGEMDDIDKALEYQKRALDLTPRCRFERLGQIGDINMAIKYLQQAILFSPKDDVLRAWWLNNLNRPYYSRFTHLQDVDDLNQAIDLQNEALSLTPIGYAYRPRQLEMLGTLYQERFHLLAHPQDLGAAVDSFKAAATSIGHAVTRLQACRSWAKLCMQHDLSPLKAYTRALELIPQIVWLGTTVSRRYDSLLAEVQDIAMEAAAAAIQHQQYNLALEWLEEGRSVVWNQMLQLRTPFDHLSRHDPNLANQFQKVAEGLEKASGLSQDPERELIAGVSMEQSSQEHRRLAEEWDRLLNDIRSIPSLRNFLKPKNFGELLSSTMTGVVVVINVHRNHCDALALLPGSRDVMHIPSSSLSYNTLINTGDRLVRNTRIGGRGSRRPILNEDRSSDPLESILNMLWIDVVRPVLDSLGYLVSRGSMIALPHVTWCPTGPLTVLPLHAAGYYDRPLASACDFVISSYSPAISALLPLDRPPSKFQGLLAVGEAAAKTNSPLPGTVAEIEKLEQQAHEVAFTRLDEQQATCAAVLDRIEHCSWIHLACHASQNVADPTASALQLHDGPLRLATIAGRLLKHAEFAFLSACETAAGVEALPDEAVHLAAGMMMAGYRSVVATMWSINDQDAPIVQKNYMRGFLKEVIHRATKRLWHCMKQ